MEHKKHPKNKEELFNVGIDPYNFNECVDFFNWAINNIENNNDGITLEGAKLTIEDRYNFDTENLYQLYLDRKM